MDLLWEMFQHGKISKASSTADKASIEVGKAQTRTYSLEAKLDHLGLINRAMWSLLKERTELTEKDLIDRVAELDMVDGKKDNKIHDIRECYGCGKGIGPKEENCIYCGLSNPITSAFNKL
ncbi:hypothetical protein [Malonomonas rubra]|uniref:hypothetical protein n=1 Tax=Malonomonas rubra TaxID=57040 RepID=UPI0026EB8FB4|nr:hypothetical protein [Malonomonas rubra]